MLVVNKAVQKQKDLLLKTKVYADYWGVVGT